MENAPATPSIDSLMADLMDATEAFDCEDSLKQALIEQAEKIRAIANACEKTEIFSLGVKQTQEFKAVLEAEIQPEQRLQKSWLWVLDRIVSAPTALHMRGAVRLCMPIVASYLP